MIQRLYSHRMFSVGMIAVGFAVAISSFGIVRAELAKPSGSVSYSCSTGKACVEGSSTGSGTLGVYGVGTKDDGVRGVTSGTSNGVTGLATGSSTSASGVYGKSTKGIGVSGLSTSGAGVYGQSKSVDSAGVAGDGTRSSDGVYGISSSGNGVEGLSSYSDGVSGSSSSGAGVFGYSKSGYGGWFEDDNTEYVALWAQDDQGTSGIPFVARGESGSKGTGEFYVDGSGNGFFTGEVEASGGFTYVIRSRNGESFGASVALTPQAAMEDTGTSRLLNGEGAVRFDSDFASTIDATRGYQVFLTPDGDTRGLYIAAKYEGGFIVRENEHGRSSVYFDYRVVAHPYGASDARLPRLNLKAPPIPHLTQHVQPPQLPQP
jgi:hypothetical protein